MLDLFFNFLHNFKPQPFFLRLGFFSFYWYSFLIIISLILGYLLVIKLSRYCQIKKRLLENLFFYLIIFGFIGARLYYIFSEITYYFEHPGQVFAVWQGGLGIFGAIIADLIVLWWFSKKHQIKFFTFVDLLTPSLILGQAIGRWGNYFNQEVFGRPTDLPWGIPILLDSRPVEFLSAQYFHPTFLYESIWNFLIFIFLIFLFLKIYSLKNSSKKSKSYQKKIFKKEPGQIFAFYLILYSLGRFLLEFLRIDSQPELIGLRLGQIFAMIAFISGFLILFNIYKLSSNQ